MSRQASIVVSAVFLFCMFMFLGCGGNKTNGSNGTTSKTYTVGGSISGLGGGMTLRINGSSDLRMLADGSFTFNTALKSGTAYTVTVFSAPTYQTCAVTNGTGTVNAANVADVQVACTYNSYKVSGTVSGLSGTLTLQNNGGNDLTLTANGSFTFTDAVTFVTDYNVTISGQPLDQACVVSNGAGLIVGADITDVQVGCYNVLTGYFMDGSVEGLKYGTATRSGFTDSHGAFRYIPGEVVSFYVGDILLGQANGATEITPFDLAGISPPQTNLEIVRMMNEVNRSHHGTPFEVAANIAVFLQTLDEDGIYSNGIQIPPQMHELASGADIDFTQKMSDFPMNFKLRKLVGSGRSVGLWGGTRAIRKTGYALNTMYEELRITADIHVKTNQEDHVNDAYYKYAYDGNGNMTTEEVNSPSGWTSVNYRTIYAYDESGNRTIKETDYYSEGVADEREIYTYDANGNMIMREISSNSGNAPEVYAYTYDGNGSVTFEEHYFQLEGSKVYFSRNTYTYDENGNMTKNDFYPMHYIETYTYDADGNRTMLESDEGADGTVDERQIYTYDENGNLTRYDFDSYSDSAPARYTIYSYNADSNLTTLEEDSDADGNIDYRETYTYDINGNLTVYEHDGPMDDLAADREIYTYDENGNLTLIEYDSMSDGIVDTCEAYTYDANGNMTMKESGAVGYMNLQENYLYQTGGGFMYYEF